MHEFSQDLIAAFQVLDTETQKRFTTANKFLREQCHTKIEWRKNGDQITVRFYLKRQPGKTVKVAIKRDISREPAQRIADLICTASQLWKLSQRNTNVVKPLQPAAPPIAASKPTLQPAPARSTRRGRPRKQGAA